MRLQPSMILARALLPALLALAALACAAQEPLPEDVILQTAPIIRGKASTASQNAVVMLRIADEAVCTGSLVAPNLVLTARHCVSHTDETLLCAPDGHALAGGRIHQDYDAQDIVVYTGVRESALRARARGAQLVHDSAKNLCNHDLALIVLDRDVSGVPLAPLRLTESTRIGEMLTSVGWGLTASGTLPRARMQRTGVLVTDVGPSSETPSHELTVGEGICSGDSGGPALSARGAVVGVVSSGGNGRYDDANPAAGCIGADTTNTYSRVAPFARLVRRAFKEAGAKPQLEVPAPR